MFAELFHKYSAPTLFRNAKDNEIDDILRA